MNYNSISENDTNNYGVQHNIEHIAEIVCEYVTKHKTLLTTTYDDDNTNDIHMNKHNVNTQVGKQYEPETMKLREMMKHTLDNILDNKG
jgi:hypothetical protein